jgi:hypothetical protein
MRHVGIRVRAGGMRGEMEGLAVRWTHPSEKYEVLGFGRRGLVNSNKEAKQTTKGKTR